MISIQYGLLNSAEGYGQLETVEMENGNGKWSNLDAQIN